MDVLNTLIQYASDLHLEFLNPEKTQFEKILYPVCPILVLAGDICPFEKVILSKFMKYVSEKWQHIICVPGNHEYYNHKSKQSWRHSRISTLTMKEKEGYMKIFSEIYPNIHWLQMSHFDIPLTNIRILGCTLWSRYDPLYEADIHSYMNDFNFITKDGVNPVKPDDLLIIHESHREWLRDALYKSSADNKRAVVVTHHLPLYQMIEPKYRTSTVNSAYANHMDSFFEHPALIAWFCGHSHSSKIYEYARQDGFIVPCLMNCRGYEFEHLKEYSAFKLHVLMPQRKLAPPKVVKLPRILPEEEDIIFV